jgi:hypothetical protein
LNSTSPVVLFGGLAKANPHVGSTMISVANRGIAGITTIVVVEL